MKPRTFSLQSRIILFHLLAILLAAVAVPLTNYLVISRSANRFEARTLKSRATAIAAHLNRDAGGHWHLKLPSDLANLYAHRLEGLSYAVKDAHGRLLLSSDADSDAAQMPSEQGFSQLSHKDADVYGVSIRLVRRGADVLVTVAQNAQYPDVIFDDIVAYYLARIAWLTVTILALLLALDVLIIRRAFKPVLQASRIAGAIDPQRTDLRLPIDGIPRELQPLIHAINEAFDRLEKGMRLQKEFTADAAHELRTPLSVLRARIENLPDQKALNELKADIDVMSHVVSELLDIAELENVASTNVGPVDLQAVSAEVVSMIASLAIAQGKEVALVCEQQNVWVRGDGAMIFRAIRNLVDNAITHTKPGTEVIVEVNASGTVRVLDKGPGVPPAERTLVFRRFWRAKRHSQGAGLGLSIVARIAELHGATLGIADREGGGAVFSLSFKTG